MNPPIIKDMVRAMKPVLKNPKKAEQILDRFWRNKIGIVWNVKDVHTAANERGVALTNKQAAEILKDLFNHHNKQLGLRWSDLTSYIEEHVLGRKLTKAEINRFVEKYIVAIDRQHK